MPHLPPPHHHRRHAKPLHFHKPATSLPDFIYAALSLAFLFSTTATSSLPKSIALIFPQSTRNKSLRNPNMSISNPNPNPNSRRRFSNPQALSEWLRPRMPTDSFAAWGVQPGTKNVHNLWLELSEGETSLADSIPPVRTVQVVTVRILDDRNRVLVESHQELSDGTIRYRGRPLSEKMKPGETVEAAVDRAIREELGSILYKGVSEEDMSELVKIVPDSYSEKIEERVSASYPGLPACYVLHTVAARIDCLPDEEFCTEEDEEYEDSSERNAADKAVSVKRHYWKWVDSDKELYSLGVETHGMVVDKFRSCILLESKPMAWSCVSVERFQCGMVLYQRGLYYQKIRIKSKLVSVFFADARVILEPVEGRFFKLQLGALCFRGVGILTGKNVTSPDLKNACFMS